MDAEPIVDDLVAQMRDFADKIGLYGHVNALGSHAKTLRSAATALERQEPPSPWHWSDAKMPEAGTRVVTLYEDGSGTVMGYWTGETLIDQDGCEGDWRAEPGAMWCYLPPSIRLWCEMRSDDPFTFPDATATP